MPAPSDCFQATPSTLPARSRGPTPARDRRPRPRPPPAVKFPRSIWAPMTVSATATITDGYHNQMQMGANNQLFIGARTCTNINIPANGSNPGEVRGCLSILDTSKSSVVVPPAIGDVTGIQPISRRSRRLCSPERPAKHLRHHHRQAPNNTGRHHRPSHRCAAGRLKGSF